MNVLAVVTFFPWPLNHGDALRRFMIVKSIHDLPDHSMTLAAIRRPESSDGDVAALRRQVPDAELIESMVSGPAVGGLLGQLWRVARGARSVSPPWLYRQHSTSLLRSVDSQLDVGDVVILVGEPAGLYARRVRKRSRAVVVWDKSNVLGASSDGEARESLTRSDKLRFRAQGLLSKRFERATLRSVDRVWVTTEEEADRLHALYGGDKAEVLKSMLPASALSLDAVLDPGSSTLLWMSSLSYRSNWLGLVKFLDANDCRMCKAGIRLRVIGAGASAVQVEVLSRYPSVDYVGFADDLGAACSDVFAAVVPLWSGAGVKLNTLSLMAMGIPVIGTNLAFEGIDPTMAAGLSDDVDELGSLIINVNRAALEKCAEDAVRYVSTEFSGEKFRERVRELLVGLRPRRSDSNA